MVILLLVVVLPAVGTASMTWQEPVLISTNCTDWPGVAPVLSYAENGDLRIFYCVGKKTNDTLVSRLRLHADTAFGRETVVDTEARSAGVYWLPGYTVIVAAAKAPSISMRRSQNYGHNFTTRYGYPGARNWPVAPNYMPSFFCEDDGILRLAYTYREYNAVLGASEEICTARRVNGVWDTDEVNIGDGQAVGVHESGDSVCIACGHGIYYSTDNGTNFSMINDGEYIPERLTAADMLVDTNDRIYILRGYSYGPGATNQHLTFTYSDDCGANWHSPQVGIVVAASNYMFYPCFTMDENRMVVVWQHAEVANEHAFIRCIISEDKGQTWGPIHTAVTLEDGDLLAFNGYPAITIAGGRGRITVACVVYDGADYYYYTTDLMIDSDDDGLPDWAEEDGGTDPNVADSDGDGQSDGDEAVARVDAMNENSCFDLQNLQTEGTDNLSFEWHGLLGCLYSVQTTTNLECGNWTNMPGFTNRAGKGPMMTFTNQPGTAHTFYRVIVETRPAPSGMALIPKGPFEMGDHYGEGAVSELPVHTNDINSFYMDIHEVTGALWSNIYVWATNNGYGFDNAGIADGADFPIAKVNWYDCVKWCNARSGKEGLTPAYYTDGKKTTPYKAGQLNLTNGCVMWDADGYRLPTEAEWEKASRGGLTGHHYPWHSLGGSYSNHIEDSYANFVYSSDPYEDESGLTDTTPVGYYNWEQWPRGPDRANGYGLYDMAGNVMEWCWDRYQSDWYSVPGNTNNPRGPDSGSSRIRRGGCWDDYYTTSLRCAARSLMTPSFALDQETGFRCTRSN